MAKEQLYINGVELPLKDSLNPSITKSITDIQQPDKTKADYSKTITLPASKEISKLFDFIFEINIDGTFNPNKKADALYLVDGEEILRGFLQLKEVIKNDTHDISYKCVLYGEVANLFNDIKGKMLSDLAVLPEYNHDYTYTNVTNSWGTGIIHNGTLQGVQLGVGYIYPMINYGTSNSLQDWKVTDFYPAMYVKELLNGIFKDSGYTYTSNFLTNDIRFKRLILPFVGKAFKLTDTQIQNRIFRAKQPKLLLSDPILQPQDSSQVLFINEVQDTGNNYNPTTGIYTVPNHGIYNISTFVDLWATFTPNTANQVKPIGWIQARVRIIKNNTQVIGSNIVRIHPTTGVYFSGDYTTDQAPTYPSNDYGTFGYARQFNPPNRCYVTSGAIELDVNDTIKIDIVTDVKNNRPDTKLVEDNSGNLYDADVKMYVGLGEFKSNVVNTTVMYGDTLDMIQSVPKLKQSELLTSLIKMFNLYVEVDKNNPKNLIIEPRDDYYTSEVVDWSQKLDKSSDLTYIPLGKLNAKEYIFEYKQDKDYYNQKYQDTYLSSYGSQAVEVDNDFLKNTYKTTLVFAPTPIVGQTNNDRVIPTIIKQDNNGNYGQIEGKPRILLYGGLKNTISTFTLEGNVHTKYPYSGHLDDPFNPTIDINFGIPNEIYYDNTYYPITITDNTLFNAYWKKQILEISDKNSKVVRGKFYLTPRDLSTLDFRKQYYFDNAYFRLHKIENANIGTAQLVTCEFLKLKTKATFTPTTGTTLGGGNVPVGSGYAPTFNIQAPNDVFAQSNRIGDNTKNLLINGDNNTVLAGVTNATLINTDNTQVTKSNAVYINGQGNFTMTTDATKGVKQPIGNDNGYVYADTSLGNFGVVLPTALNRAGVEITIKVVGGGSVDISAQQGEQVENALFITITTNTTVFSDGYNWYIK